MRFAVTGCQGQVVRALTERGAASGHEIIAVGRPEFDLTDRAKSIVAALAATRPDVIVSAAAYTAVDKAERESELAFAINSTGAGAVAAAANILNIPLVHLSTDYVFDGNKATPYVESDPTGPTGMYGASKLGGEGAVLRAHDNAAILRTAWVYSPFGANFVRTMLHLARDRDEIAVVDDQRGNPTSALDIADAVVAIAVNLAADDSPERRGLFHMSASGEASWADFAEAIFAASESFGGPTARVRRITTDEFPTPARRPANSRLDCTRLARAHAVQLPDWRSSTESVVRRLIESAA